MKQVMNYHKDNGLLNMIRRTDPMIIALAEKSPNVTPYHYCHNNPTNKIDVDGEWDVTIHLAKDRSTNGYGVAVVSDRTGQEIFKFVVRAEVDRGTVL